MMLCQHHVGEEFLWLQNALKFPLESSEPKGKTGQNRRALDISPVGAVQ